MKSITELTTHQKLDQLKRVARRTTVEDRIEAGVRRFERMGLAREDVDAMATSVGLEADDIYLASSESTVVVQTEPLATSPEKSDGTALNLGHRVRRLEDFVSRMGATFERTTAPSNNSDDENLVTQLRRIADHFDPPPPNVVGTGYVAQKLDCTTIWVTEMIRLGQLPRNCVVPGTGNGKPWKFYRSRIDPWISTR